MLQLTFKQTNSELLVRAAASVLFGTLVRRGAKIVSISDLAERPQYGFTASAANEPVGPKFVRITDLQDGRIDWETVPFCECAEPGKYLLRDHDLLFARTGATTGKTHLVRRPGHAVFASYLIRLRPKAGVFAGYLHAFFQSDNYWLQISDEKEGSAQPNVNGEKLAGLQIPFVDSRLQHAIAEFLRCVRRRQDGEKIELPDLPAPLAEQRRVVARIEELAAQIQEARTLRHQAGEEAEALVQVRRFREIQDCPSVNPMRFEELVTETQLGLDRGTSQQSPEYPTAYLKMNNITSRGTIDLAEVTRVNASDEEIEKFALRSCDFLFNTRNSFALVGKTAVWEGADEPFVFNNNIMRIRFGEQIEPRFINTVFISPIVANQLLQLKKQTTNVCALYWKNLKEVLVPVPPLPEQLRIVAELDVLQAEVDAVKRLQAETAAELDALLPSILDKAFKGEL